MRKISAFARLGLGTLVVGILSLVLAVGLPSGSAAGSPTWEQRVAAAAELR